MPTVVPIVPNIVYNPVTEDSYNSHGAGKKICIKTVEDAHSTWPWFGKLVEGSHDPEDLSNPKHGHTTRKSGRGCARRGGGAGQGRAGRDADGSVRPGDKRPVIGHAKAQPGKRYPPQRSASEDARSASRGGVQTRADTRGRVRTRADACGRVRTRADARGRVRTRVDACGRVRAGRSGPACLALLGRQRSCPGAPALGRQGHRASRGPGNSGQV